MQVKRTDTVCSGNGKRVSSSGKQTPSASILKKFASIVKFLVFGGNIISRKFIVATGWSTITSVMWLWNLRGNASWFNMADNFHDTRGTIYLSTVSPISFMRACKAIHSATLRHGRMSICKSCRFVNTETLAPFLSEFPCRWD